MAFIVSPVPLSGTIFGENTSFEDISRDAVFLPADEGENTTSNVQVSSVVNVWPEQVSFCMVNSEVSVPVIVKVPISRFSPPFEIIVKVWLTDEPIVTPCLTHL